MTDAGWTERPIDGGLLFTMDLQDRVLRALPQFKKAIHEFILYDSGRVVFEDFAVAENFISPNFAVEGNSLVERRNSRFKTPGDCTKEFIQECTNELIAWAKSVEPAREIEDLAQDLEGRIMRSRKHITALALLGKTERLEHYKSRLGTDENELHPLIEQEHLDRAIKLSNRVLETDDTLTALRDLKSVPS